MAKILVPLDEAKQVLELCVEDDNDLLEKNKASREDVWTRRLASSL